MVLNLLLSFPSAETGIGKLSEQAYLKCGKTSTKNGEKITTYRFEFRVEPEYGIPGAILIKNQHKKKRFFLQSASLKTPNNEIIQFDCNSWVYPVKMTKTDRIFFSNNVSGITNDLLGSVVFSHTIIDHWLCWL